MKNCGAIVFRKRAFTLIELLVVISIIALLMGIIMPALRAARDQARLVICSNNQRQLVVGMSAYMIDNDSKTPPSIVLFPGTTESYSWPNFLNHFNRGMYQYMGGYVPDVGGFMCPLAPANPINYQDAYVNYKAPPNKEVMVSYNMYWGGYKMEDIEFEGPSSAMDQTKLLVSDTLNFGPTNDGLSRWYSSHRHSQSYKTDIKDGWGNLISVLWFINQQMDDPPQKIKMNMAYTDGHVERYVSDETIHHQHGPARRFQIPPRDRWK